MTIKCEVAVKGDSKDCYVVRKWNNGASNTDARKRQMIASFCLVQTVIASDLSP